MRINEIFLSLQGEGTQQGNPTIFIRTYGCNNSCNFCDTKYAIEGNNYTEMPINEIVDKVLEFIPYSYVCITGGEPTLQNNLTELCHKLPEHKIWLETNGTKSIKPFLISNVNIVMDIKCPSSGMHNKTFWYNLKLLREQDQLKFVIATEEDYIYAKAITQAISFLTPVQILFSPALFPVDAEIKPYQLVRKILDDKLFARFSLQIHKFIYPPTMRGV